MFVIFTASGGVYDIVKNPPAIVIDPNTGGMSSIDRWYGSQTLTESVYSMIMYCFMFIGLILAYRSSHVLYNRKRANTFLILGISMVLLGISGSYYLLLLK